MEPASYWHGARTRPWHFPRRRAGDVLTLKWLQLALDLEKALAILEANKDGAGLT
jgi:hypothetical protein